jgi:hypothetical protein
LKKKRVQLRWKEVRTLGVSGAAAISINPSACGVKIGQLNAIVVMALPGCLVDVVTVVVRRRLLVGVQNTIPAPGLIVRAAMAGAFEFVIAGTAQAMELGSVIIALVAAFSFAGLVLVVRCWLFSKRQKR